MRDSTTKASNADAFLVALDRANVRRNYRDVAQSQLDEMLAFDPESQRMLFQERLANQNAAYTESLLVLHLAMRAVLA